MTANLFGLPYDEYMLDDIGGVYDRWMDDHDEYPDAGFEIEEWSAEPLGNKLPESWRVIERIVEDAADDLGFEEAYEVLERAGGDPEVIAAFDAALALWASKVVGGWRYSDKLLATHRITWDADMKPLCDGEPLFRPIKPGPGQTDIFGGEVP